MIPTRAWSLHCVPAAAAKGMIAVRRALHAPAACLVPPARRWLSQVPGAGSPDSDCRPATQAPRRIARLHACTLARRGRPPPSASRSADRDWPHPRLGSHPPPAFDPAVVQTRRGDDDPVFGGMAACPCVLVLCGAPAAGKSSLSRELRRHPARRVGAVHHISFDSIERESTVCRRRRSAERTLSVA